METSILSGCTWEGINKSERSEGGGIKYIGKDEGHIFKQVPSKRIPSLRHNFHLDK